MMSASCISSRPEAEKHLHALCIKSIGHLNELRVIHLAIDSPQSKFRGSEAEYVLRLRKVHHHIKAIVSWPIDADSLHVMAPDIRATMEQLTHIVSNELYDVVNDARSVMESKSTGDEEKRLSLFSHPSPFTLIHSRNFGGFGGADNIVHLCELYLLLARLVVDYCMGLGLIAEVLDRSKQAKLLDVLNRSGSEVESFSPDNLLRLTEQEV